MFTVAGASGSIEFSGPLTARGGEGPFGGGAGGALDFQLDPSNNLLTQHIALRGYSDVILDGGTVTAPDGTSSGGIGGPLSIQQDALSATGGPAGAVVNNANVSAVGGDGASGGAGGTFIMFTQQSTDLGDSFEIANNTGSVDVRGGAEATLGGSAGAAGTISMFGMSGAKNSGAMSAAGGFGHGVSPADASGGSIIIRSYGTITNSGILSAIGGGDVQKVGGNGGTIAVEGSPVVNSAALTCDSGGSNPTGGDVYLTSDNNGPTTDTGVLSALPDGLVSIDGANNGTSYHP